MTIELHLGDCLEVMRGMADKSVDAVITDPPYFRIVDAQWDKQWKTLEDYIGWLRLAAQEWRRLLKDNGSLYVFADDKVAAYVQVELDKEFLLLNHLIWNKQGGGKAVMYAPNFRCYAPTHERILFYSAQYNPTGSNQAAQGAIRGYLRSELQKYGIASDINKLFWKNGWANSGSNVASHFFGENNQNCIPTPENYKRLQSTGYFQRDYEDLRREYEELRREYEELRRPFNADAETLDVITGPIVSGKDNTAHPTTKPLWLMRRLVTVSTNPDMTVLDCFMGSGTTGVACVQTGRNFIGIEIDPTYYAIAEKRIAEAQMQPRLEIA